MSRIHLTDSQWAFMEPLLPPPARTGRPRANDRRTIEGILYILITGCRWQDLPPEYDAPTTVWRRLKRWGEEGVWERIWRVALARLDHTASWTGPHGLSRWLVRARQERWRARRLDQKWQRDEVDARSRGHWSSARVPPGQCQPCGGAAGAADVGHHQSRSPAWSP